MQILVLLILYWLISIGDLLKRAFLIYEWVIIYEKAISCIVLETVSFVQHRFKVMDGCFDSVVLMSLQRLPWTLRTSDRRRNDVVC